MPKTVSEYRSALNACDERIRQAQVRSEQALAAEKAHKESLSNKETVLNIAKYAEHRNKINKAWLYCLVLAIALVIASVLDAFYHMKIEDSFIDAFFYNLESPVMVVVGMIALIVGVVLFFVKKKKAALLGADSSEKAAAYELSESELNALHREAESIRSEVERLKKEKQDLLDAMYKDHPEELEKVNAAKKAERDAALKKLQEEEELNAKAAEKAKIKAEQLLEGNKMFEHPQAYVLDGQFENEFDVFMKAAEYGCVEAQEKVVSYLLGVIFKNGVRQDIVRGEELALSFASQGNNGMYELLGKAYLYGEGALPKDEEKGLAYLDKASTRGRQNAMLLAGVCHYNGVGCEADEAEAKKHFARAAKQGNAQAIQVLSAMENGEKLRF